MFLVDTIGTTAIAKPADLIPIIIQWGNEVNIKLTLMGDAISLNICSFRSARSAILRPCLFGFPDIAAPPALNEHGFMVVDFCFSYSNKLVIHIKANTALFSVSVLCNEQHQLISKLSVCPCIAVKQHGNICILLNGSRIS